MSADGLTVTGGAGGLEVQHEALQRMAAVLDDTARDLLALAAARHRLLVDGDLLAGAVLHPVGVARVEAALVEALDGPRGVVAAALRLEVRAGQLLVAVARYRTADALQAELIEVRRWLLGVSLPVLMPVATVVAGGWAATALATGDDPRAELERALLEHPGVVDETVGAAASLASGPSTGLLGPLPLLADTAVRIVDDDRLLLPRDLAEAAGLLARFYEPGRPRVGSAPDTTPAARQAPAGLADLLVRLQDRNHRARGAAAGDIGVTRLVTTGTDGHRTVSWVVDLPGTKDWQPLPGPRPGLNDLAASLELVAGAENSRVATLPSILASAGVVPGEPVLLVGHSQGGMVAVRAAAALQGRFAVTHVVTAGSPVSGMPVPEGVRLLAFEDVRDLVPRLDAASNDDSARSVTVRSDSGATTVAGAHGLATAYVPAARAADRSDDPSVRDWIDGAGVFLTGPGERTEVTVTTVSVVGAVDP